MGDFLTEWLATGLTKVDLPSGRQIRIRFPEPRDLIVNGVLPSTLVRAVLANQGATWQQIAADNPGIEAETVDAMTRLAAGSIREGRRTEADEWEPITVSLETYLRLPDADRELLEQMLQNHLGDTSEEAAATVAGLAEFRDVDGRAPARPRRAKVEPAPVGDGPRPAAQVGPRPRSRTRRAAHGG